LTERDLICRIRTLCEEDGLRASSRRDVFEPFDFIVELFGSIRVIAGNGGSPTKVLDFICDVPSP
jgi:hypothetical protein